ncbi:hypothetical protein [Rhabdochromatium marinum]|uniref:hypothetical protein n=1 Tax=Rhabdochromatium marinum TaxID=48729 RepID=UPI0019057547|nr:hypothetical protein [Rhabdochromatium marinum]MBK1648713.1 hypothetical protein [Rhabdochromatium marinum]
MNKTISTWRLLVRALTITALAITEMSAEDLARLAQDPVGNLISVPFQNNNINLNYGPEQGACPVPEDYLPKMICHA